MIFNMVGGGGGSFLALLNVTNCTASATVTATCGSVVYTATATASGTAQIVIESAGTFTLTCSGKYSPSNVSITSCTTYTVRMLSVPSAYQEVEYIQSSGTQYIDTGLYIPYKDVGFIFDFSWNNTVPSSTTPQYFMTGIRTDSQYFGYTCNYGDTYIDNGFTFFSWATWGQAKSTGSHPTGLSSGVRSTVSFNGSTGVLTKPDGSTISCSTRCTSSLSNYSQYIFALNVNGAVYQTPASATLYSAQILNGSSVVGSYVPCYRISDTEIGLYDTVSETFFTNAGTGTFTKGGDVT